MSTLAKAIEIAARAHVSQKDKASGEPYVLHPLRLMNKVAGDEAKMAAVLHDVVEDTPVTAEDLRREGFGEAVVRAVLALSRREGESYAEFVIRCKADPIAARVKLADLEDNSNLPRALLREDRVESDLRRLNRYLLSHKFLTGQIGEGVYREWMGKVGE
jgi:guanosine-3',5'-bis(diphosphate) 3'-pyrophosphohydrolase